MKVIMFFYAGPSLESDFVEKQVQNCLSSLTIKEAVPTHSGEKLHPREAIKCLIRGRDVILSSYKSLNEKLALLDIAIEYHDGNAITAVVLFMKKTLKQSLFNRELCKRPQGANHYVCYLQQNGQINELIDVLTMLGRFEEAAVVKYKQVISAARVETKIKNLETCLQSYFYTDGESMSLWYSLIRAQIALLQIQLPIEVEDARQERDNQNPQFLQISRIPVTNTPTLKTLYYCCLFHYMLPENNFASPQGIYKSHQLSSKQFQWIALLALSKCQRWSDIDALFESKVRHFPFTLTQILIEILHSHGLAIKK